MNELAVWNPKWSTVLKRRTPKQFVKRVPELGDFDYVEVGYVRRQLDLAFSPLGWSFTVTEVTPMEAIASLKQIVVKGRLEIKDPTSGALFAVKEGYGGVKIKFYKDSNRGPLDVGNDYKSAASDALKKCASQLGICSDIYEPKVQKTEDAHGEDALPTKKDFEDAATPTPLLQGPEPERRVDPFEKISQTFQRQVMRLVKSHNIPEQDFRQFMLNNGLDKTWDMTYGFFNDIFLPWIKENSGK